MTPGANRWPSISSVVRATTCVGGVGGDTWTRYSSTMPFDLTGAFQLTWTSAWLSWRTVTFHGGLGGLILVWAVA